MGNRSVVLMLVFLLLLPGALALPRVPSEFRGWVIIDGKYAEDGAVVSVLDSTGTVCGAAAVTAGHYGPLSCQGDDPSTQLDEGAALNEPLTFAVDGQDFGTNSSVKWRAGQIKEVNLLMGDPDKAELLLITGSANNSGGNSLLLLSLLVVCSLWLITILALILTRYIERRKTSLRRQQIG